MKKNDRSGLNPFTGKKDLDTVDDDKFLKECYNEYYKTINNYDIIDDTENGILVCKVAMNLINTVSDYLKNIGRYDYIEDYYDWEFHLLQSPTINAFCMPGGKIVVYSGMFTVAESEEEIAFILGHEMAHALLDHSRTKISKEKRKNTLKSLSVIGGIGLSMLGYENIGNAAITAANISDTGYYLFHMMPYGRKQEIEADKLGMMIIYWAGYNINNIPYFWEKLSTMNPNNVDFLSTHPSDEKRINNMREIILTIEDNNIDYSKPILSNDFNSINKNNRNKKGHIVSKKYCPKCKKFGKEDSAYCSKCGSDLENCYTCSKCGSRINGLNDRFCLICGAELYTEDICPKCGNKVYKEDNFCLKCGTKLIKDKICPKCGKKAEKEDNFCMNCGTKL